MADGITYQRLSAGNAGLIRGAEIFDDPVEPVQLDRFLTDPGHAMVLALLGKRAIGFASGTVLLHPDKAPVFLVNEVGVEPPFRRRGIGGEVLQRLLEIARDDLGCADIWLATEADNHAARALYRKASARETEGIVVYDWGRAMDG